MKKILLLLMVAMNGFAVDQPQITTANDQTSITPLTSDNSSINQPAVLPSLQTMPSKPGPYNFFFHGEILAKCLAEVARNNGLQIVLSNNLSQNVLKSPVSGRFTAKSNAALLDSFALQYGFNWFIYSGKLYITSLKESTIYIQASQENMADIRTYLQQIGLINPRFGYSELTARNKILVTGPAEYTGLIAREINGLGANMSEAKDSSINLEINQQYAVFRLKYASATDTTLTFNNQQILIPGVATLLQGLTGGRIISGKEKIATNVNELLKNNTTESSALLGGGSDDNKNSKGVIDFPQIEADARLNTIIIRDKSINLEMYKNIIRELDVPAPLIQIEVLIIRIDQDKLAQKGVNWWAGSPNGFSSGYGLSNLMSGANNNLSLAYGQVNPGQLIVTSLSGFSANLQFLENNQYAKTEAKPSIATIDNLPAIISTTDNVFSTNIPSTSNSSNINGGVAYNGIQLVQSLQITPHVIMGPKKTDKPQIKLVIALQDGAVNQFSNAQMPNYYQSYINSQAVIYEGQSIILAGYTKDSTVNIVTKVPGLGDIPGLGWLFKSSSNEVHKITTMYLVTPKIIRQEPESSSK